MEGGLSMSETSGIKSWAEMYNTEKLKSIGHTYDALESCNDCTVHSFFNRFSRILIICKLHCLDNIRFWREWNWRKNRNSRIETRGNSPKPETLNRGNAPTDLFSLDQSRSLIRIRFRPNPFFDYDLGDFDFFAICKIIFRVKSRPTLQCLTFVFFTSDEKRFSKKLPFI